MVSAHQDVLPKWIMRRYLVLWRELKDERFEFDEAFKVLQKLEKPDDKKIVALFLSELRKAGWVTTELNPKDNRKRFYTLKDYQKVFEKVTEELISKRGAKK